MRGGGGLEGVIGREGDKMGAGSFKQLSAD